MKIEDLIISEDLSVLEAMHRLDETGRTILFVAPEEKLAAVVTDADVRRYILSGGDLTAPVRGMANYSPKSLPMERRSEAKSMLLRHAISALPLLDKDGCIGDVVFAGGLDIDTHKKAHLPVVIMAGGLGTRLYPYTKILPKPLIPVGELPIVEHIMHRFIDVGCNEFYMIVNYKKNMIKSYFNDLQKDYTVDYIDEDEPLGTGGGLSLLKGHISSTFFLTNCDILIDADFGDIYKYHKEKGNLITMVCAVKHFTIPYGVIELDDGGSICRVTEKPEMNFLTNTGVYVVEPRVIEEMPDNMRVGFPDIMDKYRLAGEQVGVYPISENSWMDMGQMEELDNMRRRLEETGSL
ncbi:MAG: sugar phosphate nucleotidyltransferase [Ruthenibacterium sp.]